MKRKAAILSLFLFLFIRVYCQVGNEWINYNQVYFKIPIAKDGIYKLTYATLQSAGFPVASTNPQQFQLFHRGVEQAIYVEGQNDGVFNAADFIEFYGKRNDGTLDKELYSPPSVQPHNLYNLYSDTTFYFLTIGPASGKRMVEHIENNINNLQPAAFHYDEKLLILSEQYAYGEGYASEIFTSSFDAGEGWTGAQIVKNSFRDYLITSITNQQTAAGPPQLELMLVGRGSMEHSAEIYAGTSMRLIGTVNFAAFGTFKFNSNLEWSDVSADGNLTVRVRVIGVADVDRLSVCYIKLNYPQRLDSENLNNKTFKLPVNNNGKTYLEIANTGATKKLFDITSSSEVVKIGTAFSTTLNAVIPNTSASRRIMISDASLVPQVHAVTFNRLYSSSNHFVIISHPLLRRPALGIGDPVKAYAAYRNSPQGGSFDTLVVNIDELYNQFSYGEQSPIAIFHFVKYLSEKPPRYLFLIGKGLDITYRYYRTTGSRTWAYQDLVPTSGTPPSDMLYSMGLQSNSIVPLIPTGRLTAMKPEQVAAYLNKIVETEALPYTAALWRKNVLHLSGGIEEGEPEIFRSYLKQLEPLAEDYCFGGNVTAIAKQSRDLKVVNIAEEINNGVNLVTFFGHSSASTLDFDIGKVTDPIMGYNNNGKYPVMLLNGCAAGSFFLNDILFGEDWVMAENKGAAGFIAHTGIGLSNTLYNYSETFYKIAFTDSAFCNKGIGDVQMETAKRYTRNSFLPIPDLSQIQQMLLLGDPAYKLFGAEKPDLEVKENDLSLSSFDSNQITALADSFALNFIIRNYGRSEKGKVNIEVRRTLSDNTMIVYDSLYDDVRYTDTLIFVIKGLKEKGFGNNSFTLVVDPDQVIDELSEENNTASFSGFIPLNGTKNLFPTNYAVVNSLRLNVSVQNTDLTSKEREFVIEVDTINTFNSPYKQQFIIKGEVLAKQSIELLEQDSLAYYWRSKFVNPLPNESQMWEQSSFTYISGSSEGWAQVHFPQFLNNAMVGLVPDADIRQLNYAEFSTDVDIITFGAQAGKPKDSVSVKIKGAEYNLFAIGGGGCRDNTINMIAFDRKSTTPYAALNFKWYEILYQYGGRRLICGREPYVINSFAPNEVSTGNSDDLIQYVNNVSNGDSIIMYSIGDAGFQLWPQPVKIKLGELGISVNQIEALEPGEPVVIYGRKGAVPGTAIVFTSGTNKQSAKLHVNRTISGRYNAGIMSTKTIGPAISWQLLYSSIKEVGFYDQVDLEVVGVKANGEEQILFNQIDDQQDLSSIDAETYPFIKVRFNSADDVDLTSAQLEKVIVYFTPVPEGLLLPSGPVSPVTLQEGALYAQAYKFINISDKHFKDSLTVFFNVFNQAKRLTKKATFKIAQPEPGDTTLFDVDFNTLNFEGLNDMQVFVNPHILQEQYFDNNIFGFTNLLSVVPDDQHPVVDVTFDGLHIINNDFVSSSPEIKIKLYDENRFSRIDTTHLSVFVTFPCANTTCIPERINFSNPSVSYATEPTNPFEVIYYPKSLDDGKYKLKVAATDAQGNNTGVEPFEVTFNVKRETAIIFTPPYPNPGSGFNFDFTITGNELPYNASLKVFDISGRTIREFSRKDFSPFNIGLNNIYWNGSDENNGLRSGLYFYQLVCEVDGQLFKYDGKVVLTR